ncbi:pyridoxamine 5'-phosphate oxidase family protein [Mycobacterium sp. MBM]|nr:pyridoxamine 5'-phosphate oxidase family protein [Mycobacterium sp. MBM]
MDRSEVDSFLGAQRTCRVGTVSGSGQPHVTPLWFAWDGTALWLYSIVDSQRWADIARDPRVSVVIDDGDRYGELRGVEILGSAQTVGEVPRTTIPDPQLATPEQLFAEKYFGSADFVGDGRHAWLRIIPNRLRSWDFRKIGQRPA